MTSPRFERPALDAIARELGDPGLFPAEVLRLHAAGEARKAQAALLRHAKTDERDARRAVRQLAAAADLRLWLEPMGNPPEMYRFNGIGTTLLGSHQRADDGSYVGTLWFTVLFVPVLALQSYLVVPAPEKGWYFLAKAPLPPVARVARRVAGALAAAAAVVLAGTWYWGSGHTDVVAYNGFDRQVAVTVAGGERTVAPLSHEVFRGVAARPTTFMAWFGDGSGRIESVTVDLRGRGRDQVIYNVAGRAVLMVSTVTYGTATGVPARTLEAGPVIFEPGVDYVFAQPPDSVSVPAGGGARRTVLHAADGGTDVAQVLVDLIQDGRTAQALAVARAELLAHPENANVAWIAARRLLRNDREAQLAVARAGLAAAPDAVDLHRLYQAVREYEPDSVRAEYRALLAANPGSAMHAFLAGRAEEEGSAAAAEQYRAALRLDPRYGPAFRALGHSATVRGAWAEALGWYERFAALDSASRLEVVTEQLRLQRRLRRPAGDGLRLLAAALRAAPGALWLDYLGAQVRTEARPSRWEAELEALLKRAAETLPPDVVRGVVAPDLRAELAVTAGDLARARGELGGIGSVERRDASTALRLALSDGAVAEDLNVLREIPRWFEHLGMGHQLVALDLLEPPVRAKVLAEGTDPEVARIAAVLDDRSVLLRPAALDSALARGGLYLRSAGYWAASRRLARETDAVSRRLAAQYLAEARSFALPGEMAYLR